MLCGYFIGIDHNVIHFKGHREGAAKGCNPKKHGNLRLGGSLWLRFAGPFKHAKYLDGNGKMDYN